MLYIIYQAGDHSSSLGLVSENGQKQKMIILSSHFYIHFVGEICAVLKLDNVDVGHSKWKAREAHCWNETFNINLDKVCHFFSSLHFKCLIALCFSMCSNF